MKTKSIRGLRIMIYDKTCRGAKKYLPGLTHTWIAGGVLFHALKYFDAWKGFTSWNDALDYLCTVGEGEKIEEIQFWGHGKWGRALINGVSFDIHALEEPSPFYEKLLKLKLRLVPGESLLWFRTCETLGKDEGQALAVALSDFLNCRIAGYTYVIGPWQAGLHAIKPGQKPFWDTHDGLVEKNPEAAPDALFSRPGDPRCITCLQVKLPEWAYR